MSATHDRIQGTAAPIAIANLDTDQIMPKQFLRGIDKAGLSQGLLWDLRFHGDGRLREEFVLNRPAYANTRILIADANFGCGSSREHAVWGLQQYGIEAVIASSFGEIFYSNAMNNRLLAVMLPEADVGALLGAAASAEAPLHLEIDVQRLEVRSPLGTHAFALSDRHRTMFLEGLDLIGASLAHRSAIEAFAQRHWAAEPWTRDVARRTKARLDLPPQPPETNP
ncbi:3-isopropylmalate/(R)-2-methylmalate dehydratase small subunit [Variovorax sp. OK605]|uniref:3-isopropylmalate dehydratase small subunit n=1 Tax=Variovorax sp. OK605 TaxID=1855317 RepID=UPI0008DED84A|nr:3-isopropylmalate dehydratase small subunit [Variovorax sp. OK605]SFP54447.1 3-isopropylmalate/(R)-2-methylmalate dehydratase small subunit [Variovorax sp. OK605]